ncbi:MAG: hypothetical protein JXR77_18815 [Lentisphaeria bacterium]|nr:hypothetical protein [Lentisphaeria bacterium]
MRNGLTIRCVLLGLCAVLLLSAWCYFNDTVVRSGMMISSLMPVVAYGGLLAFVLLLNPLLRRLRPSFAFSNSEAGAMLALFLLACGIPGWGLVQLFPMTVMMPHHDSRTNSGLKAERVLDRVPPRMLADVREDESRALDGYVTGLAEGDRHIRFLAVPWHAWRRPFLFWGPLVVSMLIAVLGLAAVFHRQWVHHEQLPYPICVFANSLLPGPDGALSPVFRRRAFWVGFTLSFGVLLNNTLCRWFPDVFIPVRLSLDFSPLMSLVPVLVRGKGGLLFTPRIFPAVIGLAYFVGSDVALSMWIGPYLYCLVAGVLAGYGIELRSGRMMALSLEPFLFAGGYLGVLIMVLYTGRRYYAGVFRRGVFLPANDPVPGYAVLGARLFLGGILLFMFQLVQVGLDWPLTLLYTGLALMIYIAVSRIIAETGAFHVGTFVYPGVMLWGLFGEAALGPETLVIMFLVSTVLLAAPGWCLMPFAVQALKLGELSGNRMSPLLLWGGAAVLLSLCVAVPATIYLQYDRGAPTVGWPRSSSRYPLENTLEIVQKLKAQDRLENAGTRRGLARLLQMAPGVPHLTAFAIALGLAVAVAFGRLRFARWPLHPVIFLFFGGYQGMLMAFSFGVGWVLKATVNKYGGAHAYQALKPAMIGLIAGDMLGEFLPMVVGVTAWLITGQPPR